MQPEKRITASAGPGAPTNAFKQALGMKQGLEGRLRLLEVVSVPWDRRSACAVALLALTAPPARRSRILPPRLIRSIARTPSPSLPHYAPRTGRCKVSRQRRGRGVIR